MKLEEIGFKTLSDYRAENISLESPIQRCELILSSKCNFKCPYCRGIQHRYDKDYNLDEAKEVVRLFRSGNCQHVRLSGGEPTIWPWLVDLVKYAREIGIPNVAISTNGSASEEAYRSLVDAGANDFSVSLDACCASTGDIMAGKVGAWSRVVDSIKLLASLTYTTVGIVLTNKNIIQMAEIAEFASSLGVADIRIIPAAQYQNKLSDMTIDKEILKKHPILSYRVGNIFRGKPVRGIGPYDSRQCYIAMDDMAVCGDHHFPCIIALRERCEPIGSIIGKSIQEIRKERYEWLIKNDSFKNRTCRENCLDCIVKFNNHASKFKPRVISFPKNDI